MKLIICLLLVIFFPFSVLCQYDRTETIEAEAKDGKILVHQKNTLANCGAVYIAETDISDHLIKIYQTDTSTQKYKCMCYFNGEYSFDNLQVGDYKIELYRREFTKYFYPADTTYLVAELSINNPFGLPMPPVSFDFRQSPCDNSTDIIWTKGQEMKISAAPNPASGVTTLDISLPEPGIYTLDICSVIGETIQTRKYESSVNGKMILPLDLGILPDGVYLIRLSGSSGLVSCTKLLISR